MKVHHVKKSRKAYPGIPLGTEYWYVRKRGIGRVRFAKYPRPSQIASGRRAELYALQEALQDARVGELDPDEAYNVLETAAEGVREILEGYQESYDNVAEYFTESHMLDQLQEKVYALDELAETLEDLSSRAMDAWDEPIEGAARQTALDALLEEAIGLDFCPW